MAQLIDERKIAEYGCIYDDLFFALKYAFASIPENDELDYIKNTTFNEKLIFYALYGHPGVIFAPLSETCRRFFSLTLFFTLTLTFCDTCFLFKILSGVLFDNVCKHTRTVTLWGSRSYYLTQLDARESTRTYVLSQEYKKKKTRTGSMYVLLWKNIPTLIERDLTWPTLVCYIL